MDEKELASLIGEIIRKYRKDETGKSIPRRIIAEKLGFTDQNLVQIENGTKSIYTFFRVLSCLPESSAREAWQEFLTVALPGFGLARIVETEEEQQKDREKLERIKAILEE